jgi:hypothetical protein
MYRERLDQTGVAERPHLIAEFYADLSSIDAIQMWNISFIHS